MLFSVIKNGQAVRLGLGYHSYTNYTKEIQTRYEIRKINTNDAPTHIPNNVIKTYHSIREHCLHSPQRGAPIFIAIENPVLKMYSSVRASSMFPCRIRHKQCSLFTLLTVIYATILFPKSARQKGGVISRAPLTFDDLHVRLANSC